jgi:hypothetical protein
MTGSKISRGTSRFIHAAQATRVISTGSSAPMCARFPLRCILNDGWVEDDGGQLRLYVGGGKQRRRIA